MMRTVKKKMAPVHELTDEEARELFDKQARRCLNMSGDEFVAAWRAGKFRGKADTPEVMPVAFLLPLVDIDP